VKSLRCVACCSSEQHVSSEDMIPSGDPRPSRRSGHNRRIRVDRWICARGDAATHLPDVILILPLDRPD